MLRNKFADGERIWWPDVQPAQTRCACWQSGESLAPSDSLCQPKSVCPIRYRRASEDSTPGIAREWLEYARPFPDGREPSRQSELGEDGRFSRWTHCANSPLPQASQE